MRMQPFLDAIAATQIHFIAVLAASVLGAWMLARPKGTPVHRATGRVWMAAMAVAALSSFAIRATLVPLVGPFGIIHLLSVYVLFAIYMAASMARAGRIGAHRKWVVSLYLGAILGAGAGALAPGRLISRMLGYA